MLSTEDHSGIVTFLLGIVILVLVAVGFSIVLDKRLNSSSGVSGIKREIAADAMDLAEIRALHEERERMLADAAPRLKSTDDAYLDLKIRNRAAEQQQEALTQQRAMLKRELGSLDETFANYRERYRRTTWERAVGERIATLKIKGGQDFRDVVITRVTPVGLEIRHEHGNARIQAPDLDEKLQDRFQWNEEERRDRLKDEAEDSEEIAPPVGEEPQVVEPAPVRRPAAVSRPPSAEVGREELVELRAKVTAWRTRIARLNAEQQTAAQQASYGSGTSVPGSLETWRAKSARLAREVAIAQGELSVAKSRLAAVSPQDSALKEPRSSF